MKNLLKTHGRDHRPGGWDPIPGLGLTTVGVTTETIYIDAASADSFSTADPLTDGAQYLISVQGTYSLWNEVLDVGTPESNAMFPGSTSGRASTEVGKDADTLFAYPSDRTHTIGHDPHFEISLDGGTTFRHIEPDDGSHSTPTPGHLYQYTVTGEGSVVAFRVTDTPGAFPDNYGKLLVTVQVLDGSTGGTGGGAGDGAGSLVPPTDATQDGYVLSVLSGIPAWTTIDGGSA